MYVSNAGTFSVRGDASSLTAANVTIGALPNGTTSTGTMLLSHPAGPMNNNLTLGDNTVITVKPDGLLEFRQTHDSATTGGLVGGRRIDNYGTISRPFRDDFDEPVYCQPFITNLGASAVLRLGDNGGFYINNLPTPEPSLWQVGGRTELGNGARLYVTTGVLVQGGDFVVKSGQGLRSDSAYLGGDLTLSDGNLIVGDVNGRYTTFQISGTLVMTSGQLRMNVDGRNSGVSDQIQVAVVAMRDGNSVTLQVTTDNQVAPAGNAYSLIYGEATPDADFAFFEWLGADPVGYAVHGWFGTDYVLQK